GGQRGGAVGGADREVHGAGVVGLGVVEGVAGGHLDREGGAGRLGADVGARAVLDREVVDRARVDRERVGGAGRAGTDRVVDHDRVRLRDRERGRGRERVHAVVVAAAGGEEVVGGQRGGAVGG